MNEINDSSNSSIKEDTSSYYSSQELSPVRKQRHFNGPTRIGMTYYDPQTYIIYPFMLPLKDKSIQELTQNQIEYKKLITILDIAIVILNIISFSVHYAWIMKTIKNDYKPISSSNQYLYSTFVLSLIVIGCIIARMLIHIKEKRVLHLINIIFYYDETEYYYLICIESVIHLIQPYPWLKDLMWKSIHSNYELRHSLNVYLFVFTLVRLYTVCRLMKKCSTFNTERAKRMLSYYSIPNDYNFIFKSKIRNNDALFFIIILIGFLLIGGFVITALECLVDKDSFYLSYLNSIWDLSLMILSISYNTKLIKNPLNNVLETIMSYIGMFLLTILLLNFLSWIHLDQDEEKAYKVIEIIKYKSQKGFIKQYLDEYIKYKMMKMRKRFDFQEFYLKKQAFLIIRKNKLIKMKQCLNERYEINDFVNGILSKRDNTMNVNNNQFITELRLLENNFVNLKERNDILTQESKQIKADSNRICNLAKIMTEVGSFAKIQNINVIKGRELISSNEISVSLREFQVKYKDRYEKGNDIIINAKFNDSSTGDDNSSDFLSFYGSSDCE